MLSEMLLEFLLLVIKLVAWDLCKGRSCRCKVPAGCCHDSRGAVMLRNSWLGIFSCVILRGVV